MIQSQSTRERLLAHYRDYPLLHIEDIFKYLFQSAFGCEHLLADKRGAIAYIEREAQDVQSDAVARIDALDGAYSRVHLSYLRQGLHAETLGELFCLSAKAEPDGPDALSEKLPVARTLISQGEIPLSVTEFDQKLAAWGAEGFPAVHHSSTFRSAYRPAYRVISNQYANLLPLLISIDKQLDKGSAVIAIEGGSAAGKTTLAKALQSIYGCAVFHMDDFFLRPAQRTAQRLAEAGGNVDGERFLSEVLIPLSKQEQIQFRRYDCHTQALQPPVSVTPTRLTVIEGTYCMHPALAPYYNLSVFLDVDPSLQVNRIQKRNSPELTKRFFEEWIPLEAAYFASMQVKARCTLSFHSTEDGQIFASDELHVTKE